MHFSWKYSLAIPCVRVKKLIDRRREMELDHLLPLQPQSMDVQRVRTRAMAINRRRDRTSSKSGTTMEPACMLEHDTALAVAAKITARKDSRNISAPRIPTSAQSLAFPSTDYRASDQKRIVLQQRQADCTEHKSAVKPAAAGPCANRRVFVTDFRLVHASTAARYALACAFTQELRVRAAARGGKWAQYCALSPLPRSALLSLI